MGDSDDEFDRRRRDKFRRERSDMERSREREERRRDDWPDRYAHLNASYCDTSVCTLDLLMAPVASLNPSVYRPSSPLLLGGHFRLLTAGKQVRRLN